MREKMVDGTLMLFRIPGDSDNIIVNSQVTKNLILVTAIKFLVT